MIENNKNISFWSADLLCQMDVVIVGGGIVGVNTAISLSEMLPGRGIHIIDKGNGRLGASVRNAGFACFGSVSEIMDDINLHGLESALSTIKMRWEGLGLLRNRVGDDNMNYAGIGGFELFENDQLREQSIGFIPLLNDKISDIVKTDQCFKESKTAIGLAIFNQQEGVLHSGKMMRRLCYIARRLGVQFHYGIEASKIDAKSKTLDTDIGPINYNDCIVTTNAWTSKLLPSHDVKPARNHVIVTNELSNNPVDGAFHMDKGYVYFRNVNNRILIGGARNIDLAGEETYDLKESNESVISKLKSILESRILKGKAYEIEYQWTGLLGVSGNKMPIIKKQTDGLYLAVKMGGMGVAIGSYVGKEIASVVSENYKL